MSLNKKILLVVLAISTLATAITSILQLGIDYQISKSDLNSEVEIFFQSATPGLENSLWQMNIENIKNQVDSALTNQEFISIQVFDENSEVIYQKSKTENFKQMIKKDTLLKNPSSELEKIGRVELTYTLDHIHHHLIQKIYSIILFNFLKSIIISILLLQIFYFMSVKRLNTISRIIKKNDWSINAKYIHESSTWLFPKHKDEINNIESALNEASQLISKHVQTITDNATSSARLAELGIFAAGIAHEINNPLAIITGNSAVVEKELLRLGVGSDKIKHYLDRTNNSVLRIQKIIASIKLLSRDASSDEIVTHSIQQIIDDTLIYCAKKIEQSQTQIFITIDPPDLPLQCRHVEISQVLLNLINNSIDAIENCNEKWIKISFHTHSDDIICTFTDSGLGIPLEIQEKMFVPFYTTKSVGKGTGLGLSLVNSVLLKNNATIKINNDCVNTQFLIKFENQLSKTNHKKVA